MEGWMQGWRDECQQWARRWRHRGDREDQASAALSTPDMVPQVTADGAHTAFSPAVIITIPGSALEVYITRQTRVCCHGLLPAIAQVRCRCSPQQTLSSPRPPCTRPGPGNSWCHCLHSAER